MNRSAASSKSRVALLSLEPWDEVWRRNQYLVRELVAQGLVGEIMFVEPASSSPAPDRRPLAGVTVHQPRRRLPVRLGGLRETALRLRRRLVSVDVLWVNAPDLGVHCLVNGRPTLYDVTDDWREASLGDRYRKRLVSAENVLADRALTVVCSEVLAQRWRDRYGVEAVVVHNGVDLERMRAAVPVVLDGPGPHVGYVGTLHDQRIDVPLVGRLAATDGVGSVHLVGPDSLTAESRDSLRAAGVQLHGPVPAEAVPGWLLGLDVLLSPHVVSPFTLSLDAIKSYEYLATGRPIVATPTSGFQHLGPPVVLADSGDFPAAVLRALQEPLVEGRNDVGWSSRAVEFAAELASA